MLESQPSSLPIPQNSSFSQEYELGFCKAQIQTEPIAAYDRLL